VQTGGEKERTPKGGGSKSFNPCSTHKLFFRQVRKGKTNEEANAPQEKSGGKGKDYRETDSIRTALARVKPGRKKKNRRRAFAISGTSGNNATAATMETAKK